MIFNRQPSRIKFLNQTVPEPRVLLDFLAFEKHVRQIREKRGSAIPPQWYDHAGYYVVDMASEKTFGTGEEVVVPAITKAPDYEFEIACFVTHDAFVTTQKEALEFFKKSCFLTILNDWSCRDVQMKDMQALGPTNSKFIIGKSFGPMLVPASEFKMDENGVLDIEMILTVNGQERNRTNYNTIYHTHPQTKQQGAWSFPRIMAFLGQHNITVHAGYVLGSGTVGSGCIAEFAAKIDPKTGNEVTPATYPWLKDGDVVRMEAVGIGVLENRVKVLQHELAQTK
jgi:2-keto-4-pentenoate hydratase/2-oxohepta-3-ene-1,7-dioic acid hydratase in catechol pathway